MAFDPLDFFPAAAARPLDAYQPIPLVARTTVAFIGRTERGPLNEPMLLTSFEQYRRAFGGYCAFGFLPLAVQHFFLHGGEAAVVVRVANRATRAVIEIPARHEVLRLQARQPGSRELLRVSVDYDRLEREPARFNLVVQRVSRIGSQLVDDQELFQALSMNETDDGFVAPALESSELVRLSGPLPQARPDATRASRPGDPIPYVDMCKAGSDGEELTDYDIIGSNTERTGLFALDGCEQIDLLCIPAPPGRDLGSTSFVAALRYCERRRAMLVWDPPWSWQSADAAVFAVRSAVQVSQNAITYFPRVRPRGDGGRYRDGIPACGAVAGILARNDRSGVWRALAPSDSLLRANLAPMVDTAPRQAAMLQQFGVNVFIRAVGGNCALRGNVSFIGPNGVSRLWQRLDRRRLAFFILSSIERHTRWALEIPADAEAAAELERQLWIFLSRLHQQDALRGSKPEQALLVRTEAITRAADSAAVLMARIGFALREANEFLVYELLYTPPRISIHAVPALEAEQYG